MAAPKKIFISHISEERELASLLKARIERHFLGMVDVFVSSDQESIQAGEAWLDAVGKALRSAELQVVLCSPRSIARPWVNFEAGAAWLRGIPVVPLCHGGLELRSLPMPLSALQGGSIADPGALDRLYQRIAKILGCGVPEIDWKALASALANCDALPAPEIPAPTAAEAQTPEAFSRLCDLAVNHIDPKVRIDAITAMASYRTPGDITPLFDLLIHNRWQVAEACARALGRFKDPRAIPYLIKASDLHVDWITTQASVEALGAFAPAEPERVCPALIRALDMGSFESEAAIQSLMRYGETAVPYLSDSLAAGRVKDPLPAVKALAMIGGAKALAALEQYRGQVGTMTGTSRAGIQTAVDRAIAQLR